MDGDLILAAQNESEDPDAAAELQDVLRISLSGCHVQAVDDITILSCAKLRICNLQACYIRDISPFYGCIHLLKLELSDNQVLSESWNMWHFYSPAFITSRQMLGKDIGFGKRG